MVEAISVIKYEGSNEVLVYKHPNEDFTIGSQLIVHETQMAIFFKDGMALDIFGPGRHTLVTNNIPKVRDYMKLGTGGVNVFHAEVYFVNLVTIMGVKWGTDSKVRLFDPASGLHIEIGASGSFNMKVSDPRQLVVKLVGTTDALKKTDIVGASDGLACDAGMFRPLIVSSVKTDLARIIKEENINILEVDAYLDLISQKLKTDINAAMVEYGLTIPEFYVTSIATPDDDPNYIKLQQQYAEKTLKVREEEIKKAEAEAARERMVVEAETGAQIKAVSAQGDADALLIKAQAEAEAYKLQAQAEAEEMKMKGYTYQQETARQVGMEAMQNGITGGAGSGGAGGGIGDIASLGVTLGAMGGVMNMTKEALNPIMGTSQQIGEGFGNQVNGGAANGWTCAACGKTGITSKFCPDCGAAPASTWTCAACGKTGITSKFCPDCGSAPASGWTCAACGKTDITSKFCPDCGAPKS